MAGGYIPVDTPPGTAPLPLGTPLPAPKTPGGPKPPSGAKPVKGPPQKLSGTPGRKRHRTISAHPRMRR